MKIRMFLAGAVALLCTIGLQAQESKVSYYANVSACAASPSWEDVKTGYGINAAFGAVIRQHHVAAVELLYLRHDMDEPRGWSGTMTSVPVLATYRYALIFGESGWSLQLGASAGCAWQKASGHNSSYNYSKSKVVAAAGLQAVVDYKINAKFSVNAGLKPVWTSKFNDSNGSSGTDTVLTLGASCHF